MNDSQSAKDGSLNASVGLNGDAAKRKTSGKGDGAMLM